MIYRHLILSIIPIFLLLSQNCQAQVTVITHSSVQEAKLSLNVARAIFSMRKTHWKDGSKISVYVFNPKKNKVHNTFVTKVLKLLPHQLNKVWIRNIFTGVGEKPIEVEDEQEMLSIISSTPGAIGYVSTMPDLQRVKVLPVSNKK